MIQPIAPPHDAIALAEERWAALLAVAAEQGIDMDVPPDFAARLLPVFAFSDFVSVSWTRWPEIVRDQLRDGDFDRSFGKGGYLERSGALLKSVSDESDLSRKLRRWRCRELTRIAVRDLLGIADLEETMEDLSAFADAAIQSALTWLHTLHEKRYGRPVGKNGSPQHLVVIGMGKLGARELNFSSDVDLIFAYPEEGETKGGSSFATAEDFFVRLCRRLIQILSEKTSDGIVFRVDMNLRPFGDSGPLVMTFDAMESYYQEQGREWERYAWIKARISAGDMPAGDRLLERLNPFIYRRYLDYGVFESLRDMKQKIAAEVTRRGMAEHIKLGPGGIREVEFFGQIFQLIRGGVVPALQERRIQKVLNHLADTGYIGKDVCHYLQDAYVFLRRTEHRLQEAQDRQTHSLPESYGERVLLAQMMGFSDYHDFYETLTRHRSHVHEHFNRLLRTDPATGNPPDADGALHEVWRKPVTDDHLLQILSSAGYDPPEPAITLIADFKEFISHAAISLEGLRRIDRLLPRVLFMAGRSGRPIVTLDRILSLMKAVSRRTSYVSLLLENPQALDHLVKLANTSAWILTFLTRHPVLLDELLDRRTLFSPPEREALEKELDHRLKAIDDQNLEYQMDEMRLFKQVNVLRVAAADVENAIPLMRVSDHLSDIAEAVVEKALDLAWNHLSAKHGRPSCRMGLAACDRGFAVIAYGKLGGLELGYGSDLDLVFLHSGSDLQTDGRLPIDSASFFARLGQRVLHILTAHTALGRLYEADMRLRPSGDSGVLVSSIEAFRAYQLEEAWIWEKQALIRARPIGGDTSLRGKFQEIRRDVLTQPKDQDELRREISDMRLRMRKELSKPDPEWFDLKQGPGGMIDIEFLVQYLVLVFAPRNPEILDWTDNVRLIGSLARVGAIDETTAYFLRKAFLIYRSVVHKQNLQEQPARVASDRFIFLQNRVAAIWEQHLGPLSPSAGP